ncbi:MAG: hypothetical protein ACYS9V_11470, partial [Planctomycetota bacterium]
MSSKFLSKLKDTIFGRRNQAVDDFHEKKKRADLKEGIKKGTWTQTDLAELKRLFPDNSTAAVAAKLGRGTDAVKKKASRMGLRKSSSYLESIGRKDVMRSQDQKDYPDILPKVDHHYIDDEDQFHTESEEIEEKEEFEVESATIKGT